jgi:class 3 adenylate cyclase/tetratricopeptide (TPR) repeat protein
MATPEELELAIAAQEQLRGTVPDAVVDATIAALHEQLAVADPPNDRRRHITVLFADVSGFTALSEQLDAELVHDVMNRVWTHVDAVISAHGGRVDKHIGDAVMGVWGTEGTREDDPERAVRAALALQDSLTESRLASGHNLLMRVGVNTGPALVGRVGTVGESSVIGDAVNVASRLQHAAPLGGILISHFTYRHVRGVFDVDALEPIRVKGKADPLRVYRVLKAKPRAFRMATRGVEGVETRMVGRDAELSVLRRAFQAVAAGGEARTFTIVGDAGVGKSRLLYEFEDWIDLQPEGAFFFKGRALATRQAVPYGLFRDVVAMRLGVQDSDTTTTVATKLREGTSAVLSAQEADVLGHWLGFDLGASDAVQRLRGSDEYATVARAHLARYLERLAAEDTVVLFLEDLHWSDDESLDLAAFLTDRLQHARVLIVGAARSSLLERRADWWSTTRAAPIQLAPLSEHSTHALVDEILQRADEVPVALNDLIVERAEGNAFYVEEIVKMLIDDGVIRVGADRWQIILDRLDAARVPATLTGVLQARLDALGPEERGALQRASVIGRVFWDDAVAAMGGVSRAATAKALQLLRERELVYQRDGSSFEASTEFIFKHALLRDVAYDTVLLREREQLHRRAAIWIETNCGPRRSKYLEVIAEHHERAGDSSTAADRLLESAAAASSNGNHLAVRRSLEHALTLWRAAQTTTPLDALALLAEAYWRLGDLDAAERALTALFGQDPEPAVLASALAVACAVAALRGDHDAEGRLIEQHLAVAEPLGGASHARALVSYAYFAAQSGDGEDAGTAGKQAAAIAEEVGDQQELSRALTLLGLVAILADDYDEAERVTTRALEGEVRMQNSYGQSIGEANLGMIAHLRGDAATGLDATAHYHSARHHYLKALALTRDLGARVGEANQLNNLAQLAIRLGDDADARTYLRDALVLALGAQTLDLVLFGVVVEADRLAALGDLDRSLALLGLARDHAACTEMIRQEIDRAVARIDLDDGAINAGLARGSGLDFDTEVAELTR